MNHEPTPTSATEPPIGFRLRVVATALAMVAVGVLHFVTPEPFERIVPPWLPAARWLVWASGAAEIALGAGLLLARTRALSAIGLIALYVAVFPANVHMAVNRVSLFANEPPPPVWALYARLPLQALFVANAWGIARASRKRSR